jgi:hypothetical protein
MPQVRIEWEGKSGSITYEDGDLENFKLDFPDRGKRAEIEAYLHKERIFLIPESQQIDDYREDKARPIDGFTYFELALCTLYANTGVLVYW